MPTPEEIAADAAKAKEAEETAEKARLEQEAKALADANAKKSKEDLQAELDERNKKIKELGRENKERREKLELFEAEAKKKADAELSETERLKKENDEIKAENAKTKNDLMRIKAVEAAGLPSDFAKRLTGNTAEELEADALALAKTLPQLKVAPKINPTNPGNSQAVNDEARVRQMLYGNQGNVFDVAHIIEHGGGVRDWTKKD